MSSRIHIQNGYYPLHTWREWSEADTGYFFGQFLLDQGAISRAQLEEAVRVQEENNHLLGAMARSWGYLTQEQMEAVLEEQQRVNEQFGTIAKRKGWMDDAQIEHLLSEKSKNHCFLGEALLRLQYLTPSLLHQHLEHFRDLEYHREQRLLSVMKEFNQPDQMRAALNLTRDVFHRHGFMLKAVDAQMAIAHELEGECFLATQEKKGRKRDYFGLLLTPRLISLMARGNLCTPSSAMQPEQEQETVAELVLNLNAMLCKEISRPGAEVKPGSSLHRTVSGLPAHTEILSVLFKTTTDPFCMLYFRT